MSDSSTKRPEVADPVHQFLVDRKREGRAPALGLMTGQAYEDDPRRLAFTASRYKFVAKMFGGRAHILEIGCGDGFFSRVVRQAVGDLVAIDLETVFIDDAIARQPATLPIKFRQHDILAGPVHGSFDGIYALDVFEHIAPTREDEFLRHAIASLSRQGAMLIGMPSLESQAHASPASKAGHINCKSGGDFSATMRRWFHNVFMFSMNDEVVHTGYSPMAHYLLALCTGVKQGATMFEHS